MSKGEYKQMRWELKAQGLNNAEINEKILLREQEIKAAEKAEKEQKEAAEKAAQLADAPETVLREIRDLLAKYVDGKSSDR